MNERIQNYVGLALAARRRRDKTMQRYYLKRALFWRLVARSPLPHHAN